MGVVYLLCFLLAGFIVALVCVSCLIPLASLRYSFFKASLMWCFSLLLPSASKNPWHIPSAALVCLEDRFLKADALTGLVSGRLT